MGTVALHAGLLRGPSDQWRVTWWSGFDGWNIHSWTYVPGPFDSSASFPIRTAAPTPDNFYESGFTADAEGRLLSVGGLVESHNDGSTRAVRFDPLDSTATTLAPLFVERYEPSATALPDRRVLVTGGTRFTYAVAFGGRAPAPGGGVETRHDLRHVANHPVPTWRDSSNDSWATPVRPPSMQQATAVDDIPGGDRMIVFGGHSSPAPGPDAISNRSWVLTRRSDLDPWELQWTWDSLHVAPDPVIGMPAPRYAHAAAITTSRHMIVFGGRDSSGALGDVWDLDLSVPGFGPWPWKRLTPALDPVHGAPSPRWGATATYDPGSDRVLFFGGRDGAGLASDDAWQLSLGASPAWTMLASSDSPREGHTAVYSTIAYPRVWLFGGRGPSGVLQDLREYRLDTGTWRTPVMAAGSPSPAARADHAAYLNGESRMAIQGGELSDGTLDDGTWTLPFVSPAQEPTQLVWTLVPPTSAGPGRRAGHTLVVQDGLVFARDIEIYDSEASDGASTLLPSSARHFNYFYPQLFVLPSGHVFSAIGSPATLDPATATWTPRAGGFGVNTAAQTLQYRPGRVMTCGGNSSTNSTRTIVFDANDQTSGWSTWSRGAIQTRLLHKATLLPTGDVLVTGGVKSLSDVIGQRVPQIWNETSGWSDSSALAPEPVLRNYHGTAILLPDGRVMTSGGAFDDFAPYKGAVYEPPYLFDDQDQYVRQSKLTGVPGLAFYGQSIDIGTEIAADASTTTSMCLVKPSFVTHDVNFEQRYLPLAWTAVSGGVEVTLPASANLAPPGDYMLFLLRDVNGRSVPSVAHWIRLAESDSAPPAVPSAFTAMRVGADTRLHWAAGTEPDLAGYRLYRGASEDFTPSPANRIAQTVDTSFVDAGSVGAWYKLSAYDVGGHESGFVSLGPQQTSAVPPGAVALSLARPAPDPSSGGVSIAFTLSRAGSVRLRVHDVEGRLVARLANGVLTAGSHAITWDPRASGLSAGSYYVVLEAEGRTLTRSIRRNR